MIDHLSEIELNMLIHVLCLSLIAGLVFALAVVAFVFDQLDGRSRKMARGIPRMTNPPPPPPRKIINHQSSIINQK